MAFFANHIELCEKLWEENRKTNWTSHPERKTRLNSIELLILLLQLVESINPPTKSTTFSEPG